MDRLVVACIKMRRDASEFDGGFMAYRSKLDVLNVD